MNLSTLTITISAIALILTLVIGALFNRQKSWLMTFLQCWTGVLFIISGYVKAIDPLGTAYKMEQYFAEFQATFADTSMSMLAPLFPWLAEYGLFFSIFMIVFEIVLGVMLLVGIHRSFTAWAFLLLVVFFTFLTGFTYLTGYVPSGVNFFEFGSWGEYNPLQMKVTDCGCFGDFMKLEPRISFYKDLVLLVPSLYFVWRHRDMHQLFTQKTRTYILGATVVLLTVYCVRNSVWALPHTDFRPFKQGVNVAEQKALEEQAQADRQILSFTLKNNLTGQYVELPYDQYMKEYKSYPKPDWEVVEQNMSEPAVPETKISDFIIYGPEDNDVTEELLSRQAPYFLLVCHKLYKEGVETKTRQVTDSVEVVVDTIYEGLDTTYVREKRAETRTETYNDYRWSSDYLQRFSDLIVPLALEADEAGVKSILVVGGADREMIEDFKADAGITFTVCTADDILLKTIVRSNPGIVLMKEGKILDKWHYRKMPSFQEIAGEYIK